jgi:hypothetical protein
MRTGWCRPRARRLALVAVCGVVACGLPARVLAQSEEADHGHVIDRIRFDRPESWALKYFASATLLDGLETPRSREFGALSIGLELGWLPRLSAEQRKIGFNGTKPEDLNKAPFFVRPRLTIGLPARVSLVVAAVPPVRSFGITPRLIAVAVERPVVEFLRWIVGVRGYGQLGTVRGAYTCPQSVLGFEPGSPGNLYGCQAESSDTATLRYAGGQVSVARLPASGRGLSPHAAVSVNYMDLAFEVNARTFGYLDNSHMASRGVTWSASAGVEFPVTGRIGANVDVFYAPLSVRRGFGASPENDGLLNVRALLAYRFR